MTSPVPTAPSSNGPAEQPQACARCSNGCHRCYWTGHKGATSADYDPTGWRARYDAGEIGPTLSWTARHLDAVDHATTTAITAGPTALLTTAEQAAPHRPADTSQNSSSVEDAATPGPTAAPTPEETAGEETAPPPAADRPMTAIEGLPDSVTITPLNLRADAYAVMCLTCGGGGAFTTVDTVRNGTWSKADAYLAAKYHADGHARRTEAALNRPLWKQQARALGWSTAQADTMHDAERGHLHHDGTVFYRMDPDDPRAKGRTVARTRIHALIAAGLLERDGRHVTPTPDGTAALRAWHAVRPEPAARETTLLPPLTGGQEEARRIAARAELDEFVATHVAQARRDRPEQLELFPREEPAPVPPRTRRPRRAPRPPITARFPGQTHITVPAKFLPPGFLTTPTGYLPAAEIHTVLTRQTRTPRPTPTPTH